MLPDRPRLYQDGLEPIEVRQRWKGLRFWMKNESLLVTLFTAMLSPTWNKLKTPVEENMLRDLANQWFNACLLHSLEENP